MQADAIARVAEAVSRAARLTVLTGAGVSAASGVPTFRGPGGLWRNFRAEDLATPAAFARDPRLVWEWYDWRRGIIAGCGPNGAHDVLARWSARYPGFTLLTQNVDGLHERAGTQKLIRLHGSIWRLRCASGCGHEPQGWGDERVPIDPLPPRCPACGGLARPGVVWFGEALDPWDLTRARSVLACDVFLTIGTSAQVQPAAGFAYLAREHGAAVIEINTEQTQASGSVDISLRGPADELLGEIERRLGPLQD